MTDDTPPAHARASAAYPATGWSPLDVRTVDTARVLAADAVQNAGHGHPGTAMSLAPAAYLLFQRFLRHDPADPHWLGRDRFVLSCGHSSLTLYIQLYLCGYGLTLDDIRGYRIAGSRTPGHPEYGHTPGVETTTGPLGQGIGNAVGMAMAARYARGLLDPDATPGASVFDHTIWVFASDGDLEEGVQAEAASLAGTQRLGGLVVVHDDNRISIDGDTSLAFREDVPARYRAYGWHTLEVGDAEDVEALAAAFAEAATLRDRPVLISLRSVIAYPAPHARGTAASHGSALGAAEVAATKEILGFDPDRTFVVEDEVLTHAREVVHRGAALRAAWDERYASWRAANPDRAALLDRLRAHDLPEGWTDALPAYAPGDHPKGVATRVASGAVLSALGPALPELWGGSADLTGSTNTGIKGGEAFLPETPYGRVVHFGIREHAMGSILNGITLHGLTRAFGGTFLVFSDYMRPPVRLAALMRIPSIFVWTHDSIGLGEDGPTHQPVEHLAALRAIPGLDVVRPADATETVAAWQVVLQRHDRPSGLVLTRQNVPVLVGSGPADRVERGAYVLAEASTVLAGAAVLPDAIIMASGSEVSVAIRARETLEAEGLGVRVVSVPCMEWFAEQDEAYVDSVLPGAVRARVSVEAGITMPWRGLVGDAGVSLGVEAYGASAPPAYLFERFGLTTEGVCAAVRGVVARR